MSDWEEQRRLYAYTLLHQTTDLVAMYQTTPWTPLLLEKLNAEVHHIAGGAGTWGFGPFSDVARDLERSITIMQQRAAWDDTARDSLMHQMMVLIEAAHHLELSPPTWSEPKPTEHSKLNGLAIMLVEDSGDFAYSFQVALTLAGAAQLTYCATTLQAKHCLSPDKPRIDIALIDHHLGKRFGSTLASWMQTQEHLQKTWRISYSGATADEIIRTVEPHTYDHIIPKVDLPTLITILSHLGERT